MRIFQELLKLVLCGFILLTIILTLALAGEVTIFEKIGGQRTNPGWEEPRNVTPRRKARQGQIDSMHQFLPSL